MCRNISPLAIVIHETLSFNLNCTVNEIKLLLKMMMITDLEMLATMDGSQSLVMHACVFKLWGMVSLSNLQSTSEDVACCSAVIKLDLSCMQGQLQ